MFNSWNDDIIGKEVGYCFVDGSLLRYNCKRLSYKDEEKMFDELCKEEFKEFEFKNGLSLYKKDNHILLIFGNIECFEIWNCNDKVDRVVKRIKSWMKYIVKCLNLWDKFVCKN